MKLIKKILIIFLLLLFTASVQGVTIPIESGTSTIKILECIEGMCHLGNEFDCDGKSVIDYNIMFDDTTSLKYYFDDDSDNAYFIQVQNNEASGNPIDNKSIPLLWLIIPIFILLIATIILWWLYGKKKRQ